MNTTKQVLVLITRELNMNRGKLVSQGAHASQLAVVGDHRPAPGEPFKDAITVTFTGVVARWLQESFTKAVVTVESKAELLDLHEKAKRAGVICEIIEDSGKTEFGGKPTITGMAVGPGLIEKVDAITGHLEVLR